MRQVVQLPLDAETKGPDRATSVFRARRPFAPVNLYCLLCMPWPPGITASGRGWIATRPDWVLQIECVGGAARFRLRDLWLASLPRGDVLARDLRRDCAWHENAPRLASRLSEQTERDNSGESDSVPAVERWIDWHPVLGDRCQELICSGGRRELAEIHDMLSRCLVDGDDDVARWNPDWAALPDPFPVLENLRLN